MHRMKQLNQLLLVLVLTFLPASLLASRESQAPTLEEHLEDDIELQLSQLSYSSPMDIATINELEIKAELHQSSQKTPKDYDKMEAKQNGWCGRKYLYSGLSDFCTMIAAVCQGVGAAKLDGDPSSENGENLIYVALAFTAAQGFFKKLQDNETTQINNHTKKVAKSTLAANNVLLDKMVQQSKNYNEQLKEQAKDRQTKYLEHLKEKKTQIQNLLDQHDRDLQELQKANAQVESMLDGRKQELKDQAKVLDELLKEAKNLLQQAKYKIKEEVILSDIERFIERIQDVFQDGTYNVVAYGSRAGLTTSNVAGISSFVTPRQQRKLKASTMQLQRRKEQMMKTSREESQGSESPHPPLVTQKRTLPNMDNFPPLRTEKRKVIKMTTDSE